MGPDVWDCSGLTKASYASVGVYIGTHSSTDQYNYMAAQGRLVEYSQALPGDLIFYSDGGSATIARKYHVAIYLGGGMMIEAPNPSAPVRIVAARAYDRVPYVGRPTG
jgi:cell wall-associated NlpC family hydrolase